MHSLSSTPPPRFGQEGQLWSLSSQSVNDYLDDDRWDGSRMNCLHLDDFDDGDFVLVSHHHIHHNSLDK